MKGENRILQMTFDFSLLIIELYKKMMGAGEYVVSRQLLRSATSIGANVEEANAAQTKRDFITKMSIASKEARETRYWLRLLDKSKLVQSDFGIYLRKIDDIVNVLTSIVKTAQKSIQHSKFNT